MQQKTFPIKNMRRARTFATALLVIRPMVVRHATDPCRRNLYVSVYGQDHRAGRFCLCLDAWGRRCRRWL